MKKIVILLAAMLTMTMGANAQSFLKKVASASTAVSNQLSTTSSAVSSSTSSDATTNGKQAGTAIQALYKQYKADGKFNAKNANNILNSISLLGACSGLKDNVKNTTYLKEFGSGMMQSASSLITTDNVSSVTSSLTTISEAVGNTKASATTVASNASTISSLLSSLAK